MFSDFICRTLRTARYKILEDGSYFGEVPEFRGVWASGDNLESCRDELREVLEEWLIYLRL